METVEIITRPAQLDTADGRTVVVVGGVSDTALVVITPTPAPGLAVTGTAPVVVISQGCGDSGTGGLGIDLSTAQDGDVLEVAAGSLVPTHQQKNQIYDGGNF